MELKTPNVDEKQVYLRTVAEQMGLKCDEHSLYRYVGWWGGYEIYLEWTHSGERIEASAWGKPFTVTRFCAHLEKAYGVPVSLEFKGDEYRPICAWMG